ncbi:MAG TPA: DUF3558 family protein [Amycolatopsis sp.]
MKTALRSLCLVAVLATAGCGGGAIGGQVLSGVGGPSSLPSMPPLPSAPARTPVTTAPTSSAGSGSGVNVFASMNACDLIGPDQQPYPFGDGERTHPGAHGEACVYAPRDRAAVSIQFLDATKAEEMTDHAGSRGKVVPVTVGKHSGLQIDNGLATCMVAISVGEADSVKVSLEAAHESLDELCGYARRIAEVIEPELPAE